MNPLGRAESEAHCVELSMTLLHHEGRSIWTQTIQHILSTDNMETHQLGKVQDDLLFLWDYESAKQKSKFQEYRTI